MAIRHDFQRVTKPRHAYAAVRDPGMDSIRTDPQRGQEEPEVVELNQDTQMAPDIERDAFVPRKRHTWSKHVTAVPSRTPAGSHSPLVPKDGKSVSFAEGTKLHDGLEPANALFDRIVNLFFSPQMSKCHQVLLRVGQDNPALANSLLALCHDLVRRLERVPQGGTAAILPGGGGSAARLPYRCMMKLMALQGVILQWVWQIQHAETVMVDTLMPAKAHQKTSPRRPSAGRLQQGPDADVDMFVDNDNDEDIRSIVGFGTVAC